MPAGDVTLGDGPLLNALRVSLPAGLDDVRALLDRWLDGMWVS
jgi:hypothetical protein